MERPVARLIVGLGNPGARYARTRHNVGFMVVDLLAAEGSWRPWCSAHVSSAEISGTPVLLAKPLTYMNRSGEAIRRLLEAVNAGPEALLVVVDDFNLPFGRLRIRTGGSHGGHNGLESIIAELGSDQFLRLRMGIGEESMPENRREFVLEEFAEDRLKGLEEMTGRAAEAVRTVIRDGVSKAMAAYNA